MAEQWKETGKMHCEKLLGLMTASLKQEVPKLREFCVACLTRGLEPLWPLPVPGVLF